MRWRSSVVFVAQSMVLGLAIAFLVLFLRPHLLARRVVIVRAAEAQIPQVTGPVSYAAAVERAAPAVVNINTASVTTYQPEPFLNDPFFQQFFGNQAPAPERRVEASLGSGVIVSGAGYILTNFHVVKNAQEIEVFLKDGRKSPAKLVGADPASDLAVIQIPLHHLPVITFGNSKTLKVGDVVLAIGDPFGVGQTVTMGIVSATGRNELGLSPFDNFIQTDAAINPGNSGGALINATGAIVGINSAIYTRSGGYQGIGFAIPINLARNVFEQIIEHGHVVRGWLGMEAQSITPELADALHLKDTQGVIVAGVLRGGPADKAGLRPGDVIRSIQNVPVRDANQALRLISAQQPGTMVALRIWRHGQQLELHARAINRPQKLGVGAGQSLQ